MRLEGHQPPAPALVPGGDAGAPGAGGALEPPPGGTGSKATMPMTSSQMLTRCASLCSCAGAWPACGGGGAGGGAAGDSCCADGLVTGGAYCLAAGDVVAACGLAGGVGLAAGRGDAAGGALPSVEESVEVTVGEGDCDGAATERLGDGGVVCAGEGGASGEGVAWAVGAGDGGGGGALPGASAGATAGTGAGGDAAACMAVKCVAWRATRRYVMSWACTCSAVCRYFARLPSSLRSAMAHQACTSLWWVRSSVRVANAP